MAAEQGRHAWFEAHADTLGYREELADSVVKRRHELGVSAALTRPGHVVDLLGAVPDDAGAMELWVDRAVRIEAYPEEWAVAPEQLRERPSELCQQRAWDQAIYITEVLVRVAAPRLEQDLELGIEMGW